MVHTTDKSNLAFEGLRELEEAIAQVRQEERSMNWAHRMEISERRGKGWGELAEVLAKAGLHEQVLHLMKRSCLRAETMEHAVELLSLATGLIALKPQLGIALHEAFTWVDTQHIYRS